MGRCRDVRLIISAKELLVGANRAERSLPKISRGLRGRAKFFHPPPRQAGFPRTRQQGRAAARLSRPSLAEHHLDGLRQVGWPSRAPLMVTKPFWASRAAISRRLRPFLRSRRASRRACRAKRQSAGCCARPRTALRSPRRRLDLIDGLICRPLIDPEGGGAAVNCRRRVRPQKRWAAARPARSRTSAGRRFRLRPWLWRAAC